MQNDRLTSPLELEGRPSLARTSLTTTTTMVSSSTSSLSLSPSPSTPGYSPRGCSKHHHHRQDQDPYDKHHDDDDDDVTTAYSTSLEEDGGEEGENNGDDDDGDDDDDDASLSRCPSHTTSYHSAAMMTHGEQPDDESSASSGGDGDGVPGRFELRPAVVMVSRDDDDLPSSLSFSPFSPSSEEIDDDDDDDPRWNPRSSGASTPSFEGTHRGGAHGDANARLCELVERAREMRRREMSDEHRIDDYFLGEEEEGGSYRESPPSSGEEEDACCGPRSPIDPSCRSKMMEWSLRVLAVSFPHRHHHRPLRQRGHSKHRRLDSDGGAPPIPPRRHSDQAIQVASQAFALVDRLATRRRHRASREGGGGGDRGGCRGGGPIVMGRSEYKLVCMACLHVAAKTSGLFGLYVGDEERDYDAHEEQEQEQEQEEYEDNVDDGRDHRPWSPSSMRASFAAAAGPDVVTPPSPQCEEGQTILPTPSSPYRYNDDDPIDPRRIISIDPTMETTKSVRPGATTARRPAGPPAASSHAGRHRRRRSQRHHRPPLGILSLPGLSALCHGEHSPTHLAQAERDVLEGLGWRAIAGEGATAVDWCEVLLAMLAACRPAKEVGGDDDDGRSGGRRGTMAGDPLTDDDDGDAPEEEEVRERAMACLERVVEANLVPAPPPSLVASAAILRALEDATTSRRDNDDDDDGGSPGREEEEEEGDDDVPSFLASYVRQVQDILPHGEEELDVVRRCF